MSFFNLVEHKVRLLTNTRFFNIIAFKAFQAISEFFRGNMGSCRWKVDRIILRGISEQQK